MAVGDHLAGRGLRGRDHRDGAVGAALVQVLRIGRVEDVEAQVQVGTAVGDLVGTLEQDVVILMSEITAPPFWARPVWSRPMTCLPSRTGGVGQVATTVTEPVPPMPITWMPTPMVSSILLTGWGSSRSRTGMRPFFFLGAPSPAGSGSA